MRVVACDDNQIVLDLIRTWMKEYMGEKPYRYVSYNNGIDLLNDMENDKSGESLIVFMDIKLKNDNGIDVAKILNKHYGNIAIIFISGYSEYFEDSFEAEPVYFLIKPLKKEVFVRAVEKAITKIEKVEKKFLLVKAKEVKRVFLDEIYYAESAARKIHLYCKEEEIEYYEKMDTLEKILGDEFVRCHKSFLVNLRYIRSIEGKEITLMDGTRIPISRNKAMMTKEIVFDYLGRLLD